MLSNNWAKEKVWTSEKNTETTVKVSKKPSDSAMCMHANVCQWVQQGTGRFVMTVEEDGVFQC